MDLGEYRDYVVAWAEISDVLNAHLVWKLQKKFGMNAVITIGNWSTSMKKSHKPIRGKHGLPVYLIDEYRKLLLCPDASRELETFKKANDSR
ncbi:hypothetical protein BX070DRAFT_252178 [Coemansia spiralis]|nr:hypothetical protein BX070DRAFT_252178 [Coemansia spiralis]